MTNPIHQNDLIHESSPYLLQHAHNPVDWHAWNNATLELARQLAKPIFISIGYSACHWCHVMEKESFENEEIAALLNKYFVCIKVDREERPDVDHVYMNAIQKITGQGGWPLNMFAMPDGKPFHGGTYFKPKDFARLLEVVHREFTENHAKLNDFADRLKNSLEKQDAAIGNLHSELTFKTETIQNCLAEWEKDFDSLWGGDSRVPKFPLPNNYLFLLQASIKHNNELILNHAFNSLNRMAWGGIYDQIGGGFARYSTDKFWKVPHFEKMLYDNGQLLHVYSEAYKIKSNNEYKRLINETVDWLLREMSHSTGVFYSALDADSDGEEGKYYVWEIDQVKNLLGQDYDLAASYFNLNRLGHWENNNYILMRDGSDESLAKETAIDLPTFEQKIASIKGKLLAEREKRIKPGLDDKSLTSWNALTDIGLLNAYLAIGDSRFLDIARKNLDFLLNRQFQDDVLFRNYKNEVTAIRGFLEDYAFLGLALIKMYQATAEEKWLNTAFKMAEIALDKFYDAQSATCYYTEKNNSDLMYRPLEIYDNVIPSSASAFCSLIGQLGHYFEKMDWIDLSKMQVMRMSQFIEKSGASFSNWAMLYDQYTRGMWEIAILGPQASDFSLKIQQHHLSGAIISASVNESKLPLLKDRFVAGKTLIYLCRNNACLAPLETVEEALSVMRG